MRFDEHVTRAYGLEPRDPAYVTGVFKFFDEYAKGDVDGCNPPSPEEELDVEDAFVEQDGSAFYAVQGNNGRRLRRFSSRADAEKHVEFLHRKNKPESGSRGAAAKKKVAAQRKEKEET